MAVSFQDNKIKSMDEVIYILNSTHLYRHKKFTGTDSDAEIITDRTDSDAEQTDSDAELRF